MNSLSPVTFHPRVFEATALRRHGGAGGLPFELLGARGEGGARGAFCLDRAVPFRLASQRSPVGDLRRGASLSSPPSYVRAPLPPRSCEPPCGSPERLTFDPFGRGITLRRPPATQGSSDAFHLEQSFRRAKSVGGARLPVRAGGRAGARAERGEPDRGADRGAGPRRGPEWTGRRGDFVPRGRPLFGQNSCLMIHDTILFYFFTFKKRRSDMIMNHEFCPDRGRPFGGRSETFFFSVSPVNFEATALRRHGERGGSSL